MVRFGSKKAALLLTLSFSALLGGCTTHTAPDKTVAGGALGAAWGAGTGAIIGHQLGVPGEGVAIGSGFGIVSGALSGATHDGIEEAQAQNEQALAALKLQNLANERELRQMHDQLDNSLAKGSSVFYTVYFEPDETTLRAGSIAALEAIADALRSDPAAGTIQVVGHADDSGKVEENDRLSEARARNVSAYLAARGISVDQIKVSSFGAKRPVSGNTTAEGRRLNRRVEVFVAR